MELTEPRSQPTLSTREFLGIVWPCVKDLLHDDSFVLASAVAFNALLSAFPFFILLLSVCKNILRWRSGYETVLFLLREQYLPVGQEFISRNLHVLISQSYGRMEFLSVLLLVFTASGVFIPVEMALNRAWGISSRRSYVRRQLLIMLLIVGCVVLALGGTAIAAALKALLAAFAILPEASLAQRLLVNTALQAGMLPISIAEFFLVFYFLPSGRVAIKQVIQTSIFTAVLWEITKYLFAWGQPLFRFGAVYGPFRYTVTLVFWAYLSALLLLLGANLAARDVMASALRVRALGRKVPTAS